MNRRTIVMSKGRVYTIAMDDSVHSADHLWGVVHARLIDDVTGEPINVPVRIEVQEIGLTPRIAQDGIIGLVGIPHNVFPKPDTKNYEVHFTVWAEGYQPLSVIKAINTPPSPGYPTVFVPEDLGDLKLIR